MKTVLTKNIRQIKSGQVGYWVLRWYDIAGHRRSQVVCKDEPAWYDKHGVMLKKWKAELDKLVARVEIELAQKKTDDKPDSMGLKAFIDTLLELRKHELARATTQRYQDTARYLQYHFGDTRKVNTITPLDAAQFKAALAAGKLIDATVADKKRKVGEASVAVHIRNAKALFNYGKKTMRIIKDNPFGELSGACKTASSWDPINREDFTKLVNAATPNFKALIALCRLAGLRRMEAYHLEWNDINFETGTITICAKAHWKPKDKETRYVPICKELMDILTEAHQNAPEKAARVCPQTNPQNIDRAILGTIKRAGLKIWKKPLHSLRKSCIQDWTQTYPLTDVMFWAGHSSVDTTQKFYTKGSKENMKRASTESLWKSTENSTERAKQESPKESAEIYDYSI